MKKIILLIFVLAIALAVFILSGGSKYLKKAARQTYKVADDMEKFEKKMKSEKKKVEKKIDNIKKDLKK